MKRWVANVLAGVLLVMSLGMCVLWVRSFEESHSVVWGRRVKGDGQDRVTVAEIYVGKGAVEFSWMKYQESLPQPEQPRNKVYYSHSKTPLSPQERRVYGGWRKSFLGFGVMHAHLDERSRKILEGYMAVVKKSGERRITPMHYLDSYRSVWAPHWFWAVILAVWPALRAHGWFVRRGRIKRGECAACGYDMRGGGERCPECGVVR